MKYLLVLVSSLIFLTVACKQKILTPIDQLDKEIMVVHDEVMPEMSTLRKLKKKVMASLEVENVSEEIKTSGEQIIKKIDAASEGMMDWMADYKKPGTDDAKAMKYMNMQKVKVQRVKTDMISAIKDAEAFVQ